MRREGEAMLSSPSRSERQDAAMTPRRGAPQPVGVVPYTNLRDVSSYLLQQCIKTRSVYVIDNPFLSRVRKSEGGEAYQRFVDVLCKLEMLETLSLQRSFITDECIIMLCERWRNGHFPFLCQLNLNQNLVSDEGFIALAECLEALPSSIDNIKIWALNQLRPSTLATHQRLVEAIECNPRIIHFETNWRSDDLASSVKATLDKRRSHFAASVQHLRSAMVDIQSQTPHLKVFRLADNEALCHIWSKDIGDPDLIGMQPEPALPSMIQVISALSLLAKNHHLVTLELPGNGLQSTFVEFFFHSVVSDGSFRSVRHLNLERNRFNLNDIVSLVSLLDAHYAFEEEVTPCSLMPFESLRLAGQQELQGTQAIEMNRDLILSKFVFNHSLNDLTIDVSDEAMQELNVYLQRNIKKHRSRIAISSANQQIGSPMSSTLRNLTTTALKSAALSSESQSPKKTPSSPKARFLFSPKSPVEDAVPSVDTVDDVMVMVARESPTIEDFTLSNCRFLCCLNELNAIRFSRALVSLLAYNFQLHTIALTNCGIRDPFLSALITAKSNGDFPNLVVLDFSRNSLSDEIILSLLQSPFFQLKVIRLRHRSAHSLCKLSICSPRMGAKVITLLRKYHRKWLRVFEFDFDHPELQRQADEMLIEAANIYDELCN